MAEKKKILQELENLKNPVALNKVWTEDLKKTKEKTEEEKKAIKKEFGNDSDKSSQRGNIELSPARRKAEPIVFNTQEEANKYVGSLAKQHLDYLSEPTNFNNVAKREIQRFGIKKQYEEWEQSPYFGKSYGELTKLRSGIDGDLRRGKITRAEADKEKGVIDLWRVRTASQDELASMLEEAKENKRLYSDMYSEANREINNSSRVATPEGIENTKKNLATSYLSSERIKTNDGIIAEIEARIADMELDKEYDNTLLEFGGIAIKSGANDEYVPTKYRTTEYDTINRYRTGENGDNIPTFMKDTIVGQLTDGEVRLYNTLYNNNPKDAENFLKKMEPVLNKRLAEYQSQKALEYGREHPYLAGLKSVAQDFIISPIATADNFIDELTGDVDTYDASSRIKREAEAYRAGGSEGIKLRHGEGFAKVYDGSLEAINIVANILVSKGIGTAVGALGGSAKAIGGATRIASYSNMMSRAASSTMISIADRGGSDAQILAGGIASGLVEVATESIPFEKWLDPKATRTFLGAIREGAKQYPSNFLEEALASAGNMYLDSLVMGEKSESNIRIREYMVNGLSAEEATKKVMHENLTQIIEEGKMGGAIGSAVGTGTSYAAGISRASYITREGERMIKNPQMFNKVLEAGIANNNAEANYTTEMISDGLQVDSKQAGKMLSSVIEQSIENNGGMINIMQLIGTIEGRGSSYIGSMESIDTAKAVMHMVQGKATEVDNALLRRSDGATTLLTAIEGNNKAWNKVKEAAGRELRNEDPQVQSEESGIRYMYAGKTKSGIKKYVTDFPADMDTGTRKKIFEERIARIFNLGAVKLNTDVKKIQVMGDKITGEKNLFGDKDSSKTEMKAKVNSLYDIAEILSDSKFVGKEIEPSFKDSDVKPKNKAHKDVKYWYYFKNTVYMDDVLYDVLFDIRDKGKEQYQYSIRFVEKNRVTRSGHTVDNNLRRKTNESPSTTRVPQKEESVNSYSMRDGEVYSQGEKVSIPEKARVVKGIVLNDESFTFRRKNPKGYKNVEMLAQDLGMRVMYVKGLTDSEGQALDGIITSEGIFINIEAKNPSKFAATHEFSHRMKQTSPEAWQRYQDFVINRLKIDGRYYAVFDKKAAAYGNSNENYINEEIAADYIGELFSNEAELADFIRESRRDAVTIRDMYYKILDKFGLLEEKKKAQLMWRDAYREAVLNVKDGKVGEFEGEKNLYAGRSAETADNSLWRKAVKMQKDGASKEDILKETGWFVGRDGKWRFEINDKDAVFDKEGVFDKKRVGLLPPGVGVLKEVLHHEKLYEAYPDLQYKLVAFPKNMAPDINGGLSDNKVILLNPNRPDNMIKSTLIHEVQHLIQNIEGFSEGTLRETIKKKDAQGLLIKELKNLRDEIVESLNEEDRKLYDEYYEFEKSINFDSLLYYNEKFGTEEEFVEKIEEKSKLMMKLWGKEWADKIIMYTRWLAHPDLYYDELYYNTSGEVEARDAASRISMTDSERRANFPYLGNEDTMLAEKMFDKNFQNNLSADREVKDNGKLNVYDANTEQFTVNEEIAKSFEDKVDKWLHGEVESDDYFNLGNTPVVLRELGAKNLPVAYNNNVMWKMTGGKHGVAIEGIKKLPQSINNPLMVFKSSTVDNAFVVITELSDKAGDPVIVAIHLNKFQKRLKINRIASAYGKENIEKFLREECIKGNLKYIDKIKSQQWSTNRGLQLPKLVQSITDNNIILQKEDVVNKYSMQNSGKNSRSSISGTRLSDIEAGEISRDAQNDTSQKFIKPGAELRRDVKVPESVKEGTKVRQFARTAAEAETLTDETAEGVLENVEKGKFNYTPISDKSAMKNAYASLDTMGVEWVEEKVNGAISSHSLDKHTVAMAEVLMQRYSEEGQQEKAQKLIIDFAAESTRTAQSLQAISMLKKLDKNYEVAYIDKIVENLREEIIEKNNKKKFGKKHSADIEVSEELKAKLMEAKTEEEREAIREEIYTEIAEQLPDSWIDKWNAWRYMAMLGNARTHVRNVVGNAFFMPMIASKNIAAKILEPIAEKVSGGKMERSKTFVVSKKYRQFAKEDTIRMRKELQGGGKHNPSDIIRDKKQVFDTKALEWLRLKVGDSLEAEDWLSLRHHYKVALSNYLAANKIDLDNMSEATLDRARRIAIKEAQRNTYRDVSAFANALSKFSKKNAATALLVEGLMPFKKTPVNVLKRGIEYSPAGLVKVLTTDLYKVSKGDMTASEYIDRICCSLTGTGVLTLGMLFKSLGLVSGASDDDEEKEFDELMGVQNYSLTIGEHSYTLDWLAPFSLPFFVGVEMQNIIEKGENINFRNGVEVLSNMTEPFFEMSMLQGLTGTVDTIKQANSSEIAGNVLWNIGTNYVGQAVPTLFGQIARTVDDTQRRSYDDKNVNVPSNIQYFVQGVMKKIPVLSQELEPYIDEWGRKNDAGNLLTNALQNMLSPGYYSGVNVSPMEKELKRLYGEVGNEDRMKIFPTAAVKKFNLGNGTEKNLTTKEYTKMQTEQGQTAYKLLTDIVASKKYRELDDFTKGKIVSKVYEIASAKGKKTVAGDMWNPNTKWISETLALMENGKYSEAETYIVEKGIEQVEEGRYEAAKGSYKSEFNFDASKYSKAEIGIIENVQSDWAGYNASIDMGREIDESDYRHIKVYEDKLSDEMPIEEYAGVRAYAKKTAAMEDGKENMKKKELINYLNSTDYSLAVKRALFEAIGNSNWKNPY